MNVSASEEWLDRAFRLGYFLHGERETAAQIAARAMNKLQLAASAQSKRLYYQLTGRARARKARSKVSVSEPLLLQRLVYVESESYERKKEEASQSAQPGANAARSSDLVRYFIKHLVRITTRRNSFYVTLGVSRLLYNYSTSETMELYNLVVQDPDRVHDDYYYRSRKGVLLKELKERFGELLEITKGVRGEQRWKSNADEQRHCDLVRECLRWFTPWSTSCVVPERFDPFSDTIEKLNFGGRHPDEEHEVEVNRIHAALHPDCFARLAAANRLTAPDERLELPHFFLSAAHEDAGGPPVDPPHISEEELQTINNLLAHEATRRKAAAAGLFRILVDGTERAHIDVDKSAATQFSVDESDELIEVYGADQNGPLLLATQLLDFNESKSKRTQITLESGQRISFAIDLSVDEQGGVTAAKVTVNYEESAARRNLQAALHRALAAARSASRDLMQTPSAWWKPVTAFATLALLAVGLWWLWTGSQRNAPTEIVKTNPTPAQIVMPPGPGPSAPDRSAPVDKPTPIASSTPQLATNPRGLSNPARDETFVQRTIIPDAGADLPIDTTEQTRTLYRELRKSLAQVEQVYVEAVSNDASSLQLQEQLTKQLSASRALKPSDREHADAALKISVRPVSASADDQRVVAIVRVVNASGFVIWPPSGRASSWRYLGRPDYLAERVIEDLVRDVNRARRQR